MRVRTAPAPKRKNIFLPDRFTARSECNIFEEIAGDGGVSTDGVVGLARDQDVLAVGGCGG